MDEVGNTPRLCPHLFAQVRILSGEIRLTIAASCDPGRHRLFDRCFDPCFQLTGMLCAYTCNWTGAKINRISGSECPEVEFAERKAAGNNKSVRLFYPDSDYIMRWHPSHSTG